jgi:transcriptional regulator of arginine metabolism
MTRKQERQAAIVDLVAAHVVGSQEELRHLLQARGMDVTQATLSRDLRDLHLARISEAGGARYVLPEALAPDDDRPLLTVLLPQLFSKVDGVGELIVLHTVASGAQPIAEAIDQEEFPEVLGTIAGDDTILIVTRSVAARIALTEHLRALASAR